MAPRPQKRPELAKKCLRSPQKLRFCPGSGPNRCLIGSQPLYSQEMTLSKAIRAQEGIPRPQSGSPAVDPLEQHNMHPGFRFREAGQY